MLSNPLDEILRELYKYLDCNIQHHANEKRSFTYSFGRLLDLNLRNRQSLYTAESTGFMPHTNGTAPQTSSLESGIPYRSLG